MTFQHTYLLVLVVAPLSQRQGEPLVTLLDLRGGFFDDRRI